jgi:hypothetical protein
MLATWVAMLATWVAMLATLVAMRPHATLRGADIFILKWRPIPNTQMFGIQRYETFFKTNELKVTLKSPVIVFTLPNESFCWKMLIPFKHRDFHLDPYPSIMTLTLILHKTKNMVLIPYQGNGIRQPLPYRLEIKSFQSSATWDAFDIPFEL